MPKEPKPGRNLRTQRLLDEATMSKPVRYLSELRAWDDASNRLHGRAKVNYDVSANPQGGGLVAIIPLKNLIPKTQNNQ